MFALGIVVGDYGDDDLVVVIIVVAAFIPNVRMYILYLIVNLTLIKSFVQRNNQRKKRKNERNKDTRERAGALTHTHTLTYKYKYHTYKIQLYYVECVRHNIHHFQRSSSRSSTEMNATVSDGAHFLFLSCSLVRSSKVHYCIVCACVQACTEMKNDGKNRNRFEAYFIIESTVMVIIR